MIRVLLADDHTLVRAGIRSLLENLPGVEVVGEAGNGRVALELARSEHPDILITDITMPDMDGLELVEAVTGGPSKTRSIMLSMHAGHEYASRALQAGAQGYLVKDSCPNELEVAVRAVARGETYLSPAVLNHFIAGYVTRAEPRTTTGSMLTARQCEVLRLIASGDTTKTIARRLGISVKTVETHRAQLMERLNIHEVAGLVRYALREGLIDLEN